MLKKTQIEVVKRNRTSLKTGLLIKPKEAWLGRWGPTFESCKTFLIRWKWEKGAFLMKFVDDMK